MVFGCGASTWPGGRHPLSRLFLLPLLRSLFLLFPSLHSQRTQHIQSRQRLSSSPVTVDSPLTTMKPRRQCVHSSISSDAPPIANVSTLVARVWSRCKPAALRSSLSHPRSWQAPFPCLGRARKRRTISIDSTFSQCRRIRVGVTEHFLTGPAAQTLSEHRYSRTTLEIMCPTGSAVQRRGGCPSSTWKTTFLSPVVQWLRHGLLRTTSRDSDATTISGGSKVRWQ